MSEYTVQSGDTFEVISSRVYGTPNKAFLVRQANSAAVLPLQAGTKLNIPPDPDAMVFSIPENDLSSEDEVSVFIDSDRFRFWQNLQINRSIDTFDSFSFSAPFEPDNAAFREAFRPFSYKPVSINIGGELYTTGTMLTPTPELGDSNRVQVDGYARAAVLNDCSQPAASFLIVTGKLA